MVTRSTATVPLTIDAHSEQVAELARLTAEEKRLTLEQARAAKGKRAPITRKLNEARARRDAAQAVIDSGQIHVTVTGLARGAYRNLLKNHPPKAGDPVDEKVGYDVDTFGGALIRASTLHATDHDGDPVDLDLDALLDDEDGVGPFDFEQWFRTSLALQTQGPTRVPLLRAS